MYCVYLHITPSNKCYCGITKQKPTKRWANGRGYAKSPYFNQAIQKYGWDAIRHFIIADGLSRESAGELEKGIIQALNLSDKRYGYNDTLGGEFGAKFLDATKEVMSQKAKDRWKDEGYRANQIEKRKGRAVPDAVRKKISESNKGKERSPEYRAKLSQSQIGKPKRSHACSEETKEKIRNAKKGKHYGGHGRTPREVICVETGVKYESAKAAAEVYGGWQGSVNDACATGKKYHGFHWQYAN